MARRPSRRLAALLISLVAGCAVDPGPATSTTLPSASESTSSTSTSTVPAASSPTSTAATLEQTTSAPTLEVDAEVSVPDGEGPFPTVVLVHGGGWITGSPAIMDALADFLNANGYITVNTGYTLATFEVPSFPAAVEDVACAVRFAANQPGSDGTVALIGHSAGAQIGAIVALTGDDYDGGCPYPGTGMPQRFVGLAGPYDVSRLGLAVATFFGGRPDEFPDAWTKGNPQLLTDENQSLHSLLMYGDEDGLVRESFAVDFYNALKASGSDALLEMVEGARHDDMRDPNVVGDLIVAWLDR